MKSQTYLMLLPCTLLAAGAAYGANTGFYVGGSIGHSDESFDASTFNVGASNVGYQVAAGFRPLGVLAGELDYVSFGRASGGINYADTYGIGAFALGFLPIPLLDLFGKVGLVNWRTNANSPSLSFHRTGSDLAYGAGAGMSWGSLGARLEYEQFDLSHTHKMRLTSVGLTWTFL